MFSVVLVIHLMVAMAMIALILVQQSEGGGLGSSGGGMGSFMTPRGTANLLTRATGILAACFMVTSLTLVVLSGSHSKHGSIADQLDQQPTEPAVPTSSSAPATTHDNAPVTPPAANKNAPAVPVGK